MAITLQPSPFHAQICIDWMILSLFSDYWRGGCPAAHGSWSSSHVWGNISGTWLILWYWAKALIATFSNSTRRKQAITPALCFAMLVTFLKERRLLLHLVWLMWAIRFYTLPLLPPSLSWATQEPSIQRKLQRYFTDVDICVTPLALLIFFFLQPFNRCNTSYTPELSSEKSEPTRITLIKLGACFCSFFSITLFSVSPWLSLAQCKRECFTPALLLMAGCDRVGGGA